MLITTAHADTNVCPCSHPFIYFPTFYTVKSLVERQPHPLEHAYNKWRNEIWDSCKALWTLWVPAQVINFAFVPRYLRVPFGASTLAAFIFFFCCCSSFEALHLCRVICRCCLVRQLLLFSSSSAVAPPLRLCFCAMLHASAPWCINSSCFCCLSSLTCYSFLMFAVVVECLGTACTSACAAVMVYASSSSSA